MTKPTVPASDEAWDDRTLGADENFVKSTDDKVAAEIDGAVGTQLISIRLQKALIEDFKLIASLNNGIGYQTLMKQILQRFVDGEKRRAWNDMISEKIKKQQEAKSVTKSQSKVKHSKTA